MPIYVEFVRDDSCMVMVDEDYDEEDEEDMIWIRYLNREEICNILQTEAKIEDLYAFIRNIVTRYAYYDYETINGEETRNLILTGYYMNQPVDILLYPERDYME